MIVVRPAGVEFAPKGVVRDGMLGRESRATVPVVAGLATAIVVTGPEVG